MAIRFNTSNWRALIAAEFTFAAARTGDRFAGAQIVETRACAGCWSPDSERQGFAQNEIYLRG